MAFAEIFVILEFASSFPVQYLNDLLEKLLEDLKSEGKLNGSDGVDSGDCLRIVGVRSKWKSTVLMEVGLLLEYTYSYDFEDLRDQFFALFDNEATLGLLSREAKCLSVDRVYTDWLAEDDIESVVANYREGK